MRYLAEIRVFEDGEDYIHDSVSSDNYEDVLKDARAYAKELGGKVKINVMDYDYDGHGEPWCVYSKTYTY